MSPNHVHSLRYAITECFTNITSYHTISIIVKICSVKIHTGMWTQGMISQLPNQKQIEMVSSEVFLEGESYVDSFVQQYGRKGCKEIIVVEGKYNSYCIMLSKYIKHLWIVEWYFINVLLRLYIPELSKINRWVTFEHLENHSLMPSLRKLTSSMFFRGTLILTVSM